MSNFTFGRRLGLSTWCALLGLACFTSALRAAEPPKIGERAPDFQLHSLEKDEVRLAPLLARGPVVLVVLRGWPGYQCPLCDRQVNEFIAAKERFAEAGAQVVFVYPGPSADLQGRAAEFRAMKGRAWPAEFRLVLDPDYTFTNTYGLRWNAPRETAYPSTFVVDRAGMIRFEKISRSHGDRAKAADVLAELQNGRREAGR